MNDTIIERIKKCLRLSESPNENEAANAMLAAQRLAMKHGIDIDSISTDSNEMAELISLGKYSDRDISLAAVIASQFRCATIKAYIRGDRRSAHIRVIGIRSDIESVKAVYAFAKTSFDILSKRYLDGYYREHRYAKRSPVNSRKLVNNYFFGYIAGLERKFQQNVREYGLVIARPKCVLDYLEGKETFAASLPTHRSKEGLAEGFRDAKSLRMHSELGKQNDSSTKAIGRVS